MDFWSTLFSSGLADPTIMGLPGLEGTGALGYGPVSPELGPAAQLPMPDIPPPIPQPPMGGLPPPMGSTGLPPMQETFGSRGDRLPLPGSESYRVAQEGGLPGAPRVGATPIPTVPIVPPMGGVPNVPGAGAAAAPPGTTFDPMTGLNVATPAPQVATAPPVATPPAVAPTPPIQPGGGGGGGGSPSKSLGAALEPPTDIRSEAQKTGGAGKDNTLADRLSKALGQVKMPQENKRVVTPTTPAAPFQPQYRGLPGGDVATLLQARAAALAPQLRLATLGQALGTGRY